jgi:Na+/H+ antiporter NhaD/arsenite permease-like protein
MIEILSISALVLAIVLGSLRTDINTGITALTFAFMVGFFAAGFSLTEVSLAFPSDMFLILVGITLLFYIARINGTLAKMAEFTVLVSHGNTKVIPLLFFIFAFVLSAVGAGNIGATAILAPVAMPIAYRAGIKRVLMAIIICTGANAGAFSPFAPTGIISTSLISKIGVVNHGLPYIIFFATALIQSVSAAAAYFIFKGYKQKADGKFLDEARKMEIKLTRKHKLTMAGIAVLVVSVTAFKIPIVIAAFSIVLILALLKAGSEDKGLNSLPWGAILMVTGITMLIGIVQKTGGLSLATASIANYTPGSFINSALAVVTGVVSLYSSSSGVVLPTFIPMLPEIIAKMGGGDIIKMIIAVNTGSHMVDVSPLSTLGALCIASAPEEDDKAKLFRRLLIWGLSMTLAAGVLAYVFLDLM